MGTLPGLSRAIFRHGNGHFGQFAHRRDGFRTKIIAEQELIDEERYTARVSIPPNSARIVFSGALPGGEVWSSGFWMATVTGDFINQAGLDSMVMAASAQFGETSSTGVLRTAAADIWNLQTTWTKTTGYLYTGAATAAYISEHTLGTPLAGSAGHNLPNQCTTVLSLRTGLPGRSNRGRMYVPCTGALLGNDGELSSAVTTELSGHAGSSFTALNELGYAPAAVVSGTHTTHRAITDVIVDSRVDIQRRRANSQSITLAVTTPVS